MYYLDLPNRKKADTQKLKGITKAVKEKIISGEQYLDALFGNAYYVKNKTPLLVDLHSLP